jgi:DNA repair protein RadC
MLAHLVSSESDLPRERLWHHGPLRVLDHELIALIIGAGTRARPAALVGAELLAEVGGLAAAAHALPAELARVPGIGVARAAQLAAAFELGRRAMRRRAGAGARGLRRDVAERMRPQLVGLLQEVFIVIALDARGGVLAELEVARGQLSGVAVHPREVFRPLIRLGAAGAVAVHNHPSGDPDAEPR